MAWRYILRKCSWLSFLIRLAQRQLLHDGMVGRGLQEKLVEIEEKVAGPKKLLYYQSTTTRHESGTDMDAMLTPIDWCVAAIWAAFWVAGVAAYVR